MEWKHAGWQWVCEAMPSDRIRTGYHGCPAIMDALSAIAAKGDHA
ncbi:Hypothetical protein OINT_1000899 [Brucella intermedia LMG 3301]|uniref:Uncharacterized protein n=1 Tax=Brucella intermedia LMG 3301 TaxID=641118 RepID=C4WFY9_9HYPH|nr:Hypothetical protein OINT_1000899 [Brucella intermedia LMG 3301]